MFPLGKIKKVALGILLLVLLLAALIAVLKWDALSWRKDVLAQAMLDILPGSVQASKNPLDTYFLQSGDAAFERYSSPINSWDINDIGIADINGDFLPDLFSVNHSAHDTVAIARAPFYYENRLASYGLAQDRNFSGYFQQERMVPPGGPGIYFQRVGVRFLVITLIGDADVAVNGSISVETPEQLFAVTGREIPMQSQVDLVDQRGEVEVDKEAVVVGEQRLTNVNFKMLGSGRIVLETLYPEQTYGFEVSDTIPLDRVFLGSALENPGSHRFEMTLRDRHGMAFFDFNGDGTKDVYIARGGMRGQARHFSRKVADEFFVSSDSGYKDVTRESGFAKADCPARQVSLLDYNVDGLLDIYIVCGRRGQDSYPNQLWQQHSDGRFTNEARPAGLDIGFRGLARWLDPDGDGDPDLLYVDNNFISLYRNESGVFRPEMIRESSGGGLHQVLLGDYDSDGDIDVLVLGLQVGVLIADNGDFSWQSVSGLGLPETAMAGAWLDYNNDGRLDVHLIPGGLYEQLVDGQFKATGLADSGDVEPLEARVSWFDADLDGRRDAIIALLYDRDLPWEVTMLRNASVTGNWLAVRLVGAHGNREGIGSYVSVRTGAARQGALVGSFESSHFSQGHYMVYFGLGAADSVERVEVSWPDGQVSELRDVSVNRYLDISHPGHAVDEKTWEMTE